MQNETGEKLTRWGTDGGGEFCSNRMEDLLAANGTIHEITPAYTSQRNSRSERPNLANAEAIATIRVAAGLGPEWWAEIAHAYTITKNLSPHAALGGNVPDALWDPSRVPSVAHLRLIGCAGVMAKIKKQERFGKSDP